MLHKAFLSSVLTAAVLIVAPTLASARSGYCDELRLACLYKDSLGESGAGNCHRYRENCTLIRQDYYSSDNINNRCSAQADARGLHGDERWEFRTICKRHLHQGY